MYIAAAMAGDETSGPSYAEVVASARASGALEHRSVLLAGLWKEWLHPRGRGGQWIEKLSWVDIFADPNDRTNDPTAVRRRAKIMQLSEQGATVRYFDARNRPVDPDPDKGFPGMIPAGEIHNKVAKAPKAVARLDRDEVIAELGEIVADWSDSAAPAADTRRALLRERRDHLVDMLVSAGAAGTSRAQSAYVPTSPETAELADKILEDARAVQPLIQQTMQMYADRYGLTMAGLEYQIKGRDSLMRKIDDAANWNGEETDLKTAASRISDALRYTMITYEGNFKDSWERVIAGFTSDGWSARAVDFFAAHVAEGDASYLGVNVRLTSPDGVRMELQFHTQESFRVKVEENHMDYELWRRPATEEALKNALILRMSERIDGVPMPAGYEPPVKV